MKRYILLFLIIVVGSFLARAQYLQPNAITAGYATGSTPNYSIQSAFGQLFTENILLDSTQITEGFLQSEINVWVGDSLNYIEIGEIPDYNVWQNILTQFFVTSDSLGNGAIFSIEYDTTLFTGLIQIDSLNGHFKLMPNANDYTNFTITFKASKDTIVLEQEVPFAITAQLPPEAVAFGLEPVHDLPLGDDDQYIITTVMDTSQAGFNYTPGDALKLATIAGKEIVIEDGHANNIFNSYNNQKTTRRLTIVAETVIIKSQFYLPQTDVTIHARELIFIDPPGKSGEAFICTTPVTKTEPASGNGETGLKAGSITLHLRDFSAPNAWRFLLDGGSGQASVGDTIHKSGDGGSGGDFKCTLDLSPFVSVNGGPAGEISNQALPGNPGMPGTIGLMDYQMSWLHPLAMKTVLLHAKDAYLYGYLEFTKTVCDEYFTYVNDYQLLTDEWDSLPTQIRGDLVQQQQEFQTISQQIGNNKDFFGNPAGWVPLVSFEVTKAIFDQEIDRAIDVMYLSYWIKTKSTSMENKQAAMQNAKEKTKELLEYNLNAYTDIVGKIPSLQAKADAINVEVDSTLAWITRLEDEMVESAQAIAEEKNRPKKVKKWRKICNVAGKVMQVVPLYQPAMGAIGTGLETVSDMNFNDPLGSAIQLVGIGADLYQTDWQGSYGNLTNQMNALNPGNIDTISNLSGYVQNLAQYRRPISDILGIVNKKAENVKVSEEQIQAELSNLMAENSKFKELGIRIDSLKKVQVTFYADFMGAMEKSARLIDEIQEGALSIDALDVSVVELGNQMIYARAMDYLNGMEQRARNRLLKYHYYMAKAYEYRLVDGYPGELVLLGIYNKFQEFVTDNPDQLLSPEQFGALKAIYEEQLSSITEAIYEQFINNPPGSQSVTEYVFYPEEVAMLNNLNSGESVYINLFESDKGIFTLGEEDLRINNITINVEYHTEGGSPAPAGNFELYLYHSGESKIHKDGQVYAFRHYNEKTTNPLKWGMKMFASGTTQEINPSYASQSLLLSLIGSHNPTPNQIMLFSRPSAWADIELKKLINTTNNTKFIIDNLTLLVNYDFVQNQLNSVVEVRAGEKSSEKKAMTNETTKRVMALVGISKEDLAGRQNGRGFIMRPYLKNSTQTVTLTALETYNSYAFDSWEVYGKGSDKTNPDVYRNFQISIDLGQSRRAFLNYIYIEPVMEVVQDTIFATGDGDEKTITVHNIGNGILEWDVHSDENWISFPSGTHGEGDTLVNVDILANPGPEPRMAYVVVAAPDSPSNYLDTVWVVQEGGTDNVAIQLSEGWSGLSSYIQPDDTDIETVFQDISTEIEILQNLDGYYWPGQNVNTLQDWDMTTGYAIKTLTPAELYIAGNRNFSKTLDLSAGWSIIPVLSYCDVPANEIFGSVTGNLIIAKEVAGVNIYWPQFGINTIENLEPGNAYYVSLQSSGSITFEDCEQYKSVLISKSSKPKELDPWGKVTPSNNTHSIAIPKELINTSELRQGDILGVFSQEGLFVGGKEIQTGQGNYIMVFGEDLSEQQTSGIINGSKMVFKVYRPEIDQVFNVTATFTENLPQQGIFTTNGMSAFKSIRLSEEIETLFRIVPNPAREQVTIIWNQTEGDQGVIELFNTYGQRIETLFPQTKGLGLQQYSLDVSGFEKGTWMVRLSTGNRVGIKKLVIIK
jgi:hypothetical protein